MATETCLGITEREGHRNPKCVMRRQMKEGFPEDIFLELRLSGQVRGWIVKKEKYPHLQRHRDIKDLMGPGQ